MATNKYSAPDPNWLSVEAHLLLTLTTTVVLKGQMSNESGQEERGQVLNCEYPFATLRA